MNKKTAAPESAQAGTGIVRAEDHAREVSMFERMASDPNVSVEKLERLVALKERADAKTAEQLFNAAMTECQAKMRRIATDSDNPQTRSKYASYAALDRSVRPIYTDHGFALSFDTGDSGSPDVLMVKCYVSHSAGHSRTYQVPMPADGKGAKGGDVMTKTHATGAAMSYGMRYLLKMIFNVAVGEDDNDGNETVATITAEQVSDLRKHIAMIDSTKAEQHLIEGGLCKFLKVAKLDELPAAAFKEAMNALDAKMRKVAKEKAAVEKTKAGATA